MKAFGPVNPEKSPFDNKEENRLSANPLKAGAGQENENPGALAGASGAKADEIGLSTAEYLLRAKQARTLRDLIRECHPQDVALILSDELDRLRQGMPAPPLLNAMDEAREWASWATPPERKAYCLACYDELSPKDQGGFLAHVTGRVRQ